MHFQAQRFDHALQCERPVVGQFGQRIELTLDVFTYPIKAYRCGAVSQAAPPK